MQLEAAKRLYGELHKEAEYHDGSFENWAKEPSRRFPFHASDGVTIWLSEVDLSPDDDFLGNRPPPSPQP